MLPFARAEAKEEAWQLMSFKQLNADLGD